MVTNFITAAMGILDKIIPDPKQRMEAKMALVQLQQKGELKELEAHMHVVVGEARGESWLQRNWRPITMLTFVALLVAKWMGLTVSSISEAIELELMQLIQIGLGGYIVGRSAEKMMKQYRK